MIPQAYWIRTIVQYRWIPRVQIGLDRRAGVPKQEMRNG
jgi:hypothetical protein